jgi:hypothetical protein
VASEDSRKIKLPTQPTTKTFVDAVNTGTAAILLRDLIDYAGLFPPSSVPMAQAVANYHAYFRSEWNWMLGRFILPVARLQEFEDTFSALPATAAESLSIWRLSALVGSDAAADVARIRDFSARYTGSNSNRRATVDTVEVKAAGAEDVSRISQLIPANLTTYFEFPLSSCSDCLAAISASGRRAKIRTGGETADKFPTAHDVIEFIRLCAASGVPFKATAGLHHPLRSIHRLTYQPDSPSGIMHGFLNVFLASAFLQAGMQTKLAEQLLEEKSAQALHFDGDGITWQHHRITQDEIASTRRNFAMSFGSCSFTEPIDDLRSLDLL